MICFHLIFYLSSGLVEAAAHNIPQKYQSIFDLGSSESKIVQKGQDYFQGKPSEKKFAFGFAPQFGESVASGTVAQPKQYRKSVEIQATQATSKSSAITNAPHQFDIQTKHDFNYKKPISKADNQQAPSGKISYYGGFPSDSPRSQDDHLSIYKRYGFQNQDNYYAPSESFQYISGFSGSHPYGQIASIDPKVLRYKRYSGQSTRNRRQGKQKARGSKQQERVTDEYGYPSYKSKSKDFDESESYDSPEFSYYDDKEGKQKQYDYGSDEEYGADDYARIKNLSEQQSEEVQKNPDNCKKVEKESMTCMVCLNPKTGGNFESCSYVSEPKNNKYAFVREQKFDSDDPEKQGEEESKNTESKIASEKPREQETKSSNFKEPQRAQTQDRSSAEKGKTSSRGSEKFQSNYNSRPVKRPSRQNSNRNTHQSIRNNGPNENKNKENDYSPSINSPKASATEPVHYTAFQQDDGDYNYDGDEESNEDDDENAENADDADNGDYDYDNNSPAGFFTNNEEKNNVETVLAEFANKDRSACTKTLKGEMTCFSCTDNNGMKNEECMFISESAPQSTHLAYKESKEFNTKPENKNGGAVGAASNVVASKPAISSTRDQVALTSNTVGAGKPAALKKNQPIKKFGQVSKSTSASPRDHLPTDKISSFVLTSTAPSTPAVVKRDTKKQKRHSNKKRATDEEPELDDIADPAEFAGEDSRGAFWADTVPTFDKELGISLPKFMIEKSEGEIFFDESFSSGQ